MDDISIPKLRRTWLSGYRVGDVEIALAQLTLRLSQLAGDLQTTRSRLQDAESERRELARLLEDAHRRELELAARASAAEAARDLAAREARVQAAELVDAAQLDAARIRSDAALEVERTRGQIDQLLRLRESVAGAMRSLIREFERVMSGDALSDPVREAAPAAADVFARFVEIEAGPFGDFASLSAFERALGDLPKVESVYIRRFHDDRATIEVTLQEPTPLLDEMTRRLPYRLNVDHADAGRIALSISSTVSA